MKEEQIQIDGRKYFFRHGGEGTAVVLLHGFGEDGSLWKYQYDLFNNYNLIIPDLPGNGRSEMTDDMSMEGIAEWLNKFLEQLHIPTCILIGHSMGGYVTLAFAEKYTQRLGGFGLFHSTAFPDTEEKKEIRKKSMAFIQKNGSFEFMKTSITNLFSPLSQKELPEVVQEQVNVSGGTSPHVLISYSQAMIDRPDRTSILEEAKIPVLFVLGKFDQAVPLQDGLRQCHMPDHSQVEIFERSGHMGMQEEPLKANKILHHFIRQCG